MIKITDKYYINANSNCYSLEVRSTVVNKETGEEETKYTPVGFYSSVESTICGFIKNKTKDYIRKDTINSLKDLQDEIKRLEDFIKSLGLKY